MTTIKEIINQVQSELGLAQSANIIGSSDNMTAQFLSLLERTALEVKDRADWQELSGQVSYTMFATTLAGTTVAGLSTITGIASTATLRPGFTVNGSAFNSSTTAQGTNVRIVSVDSATQVTVSRAADNSATAADFVFAQDRYSLPGDFDHSLYDTFWQQSQRWKMIGPLTPAEWELRKNGIVAAYPIKRFRIFGKQDAKLSIDAPPLTSDNGAMFVFEYLSRNIFRPAGWVASQSYNAGSYCSLDGNIYSTTTGGTSGMVSPRHTSGSASDGGVTWTYYSDPYDRALADTDECVFSRDIIEPGLKFRFLKAKRLKYDDYEADYKDALEAGISKVRGASIVNMAGQSFTRFIDGASIPDTGYGVAS